jgi:peptidoglycan hydrolase-like protein with peptidoglycan-binding domain
MKRGYFITLAAAVISLLLAGPVLGGGQYTHGGKTAIEASGGVAAMETMNPEAALPSLNKEQISELQRLLIERGYKVETTEGATGESIMAAIRQFQADNGLTVNGTPDVATLRALSPDLKKQEFFGVAPAYGKPEPMKRMEPEPMKRGY